MKKFPVLIAATLALVPLLSACDGGSTAAMPSNMATTPSATAQAAQSPIVVTQQADTTSGTSQRLACHDGLMSIDVPIGAHQELNGASYQLMEKKTDTPYDPPATQESVTLSVKLSGAATLPAVIVHSQSGPGGDGPTGPLDDKRLDVNVGAGGSGSFTLPTIAYTQYQLLGDAITSVTLCLNVSQTPKAND